MSKRAGHAHKAHAQAKALRTRALVMVDQKRFDEALALCRRALQLQADYAEAHLTLGVAHALKKEWDEAIACFRRTLELEPDCGDAHVNLGAILAALRHLDEAVPHLERGAALLPGLTESWYNLANTLRLLYRLEESVAAYQKVLELRPEHKTARHNLSTTLSTMGRREEALANYRQAIEIDPSDPGTHSDLLLNLLYLPSMTPQEVFEEHRQYQRQHAASLPPPEAHANSRDPERRLRIGYVSADLRNHAVTFFAEPILAAHDHQQFEITCYVHNPPEGGDTITDRLEGLPDRWRPIQGLTDQQVADLVRQDGIDILVDLSGHTAYNRLLVFARKPAPVQVTWIGYAGTTGLDAMDYRLTDAIIDPPGLTDDCHSEELIRLPTFGGCYQPPQQAPDVAPFPALSRGYVTFGSCNNLAKLTPEVIAVWCQILERVPGSHLLLRSGALGDGSTRQRYLDLCTQHGIAADRVEFDGMRLLDDHLAQYNRIDIALDSFPYNGGTTTLEALWMGVPVVTLAGHTTVGRVGTDVLTQIGLTQLIASTHEEYVELAATLAANLEQVAGLRTGMRERMRRSPIMDWQGITRNLEDAYRQMWRRYCAVGQHSPTRVLRQAACHAAAGEVQERYDVLYAGNQMFPQHAAIRMALARLMVEQGFVKEAATVLGGGLNQASAPAELYEMLGGLLSQAGSPEAAANALSIAQRLREEATAQPSAVLV